MSAVHDDERDQRRYDDIDQGPHTNGGKAAEYNDDRSPRRDDRERERERGDGAGGSVRRDDDDRYGGKRDDYKSSRAPGRPAHAPAAEPNKVLGVFGLSIRTTERDLEAEFNRSGRVEKVLIVYDQRSGRSRGFGFVTMDSIEDADRAIADLNGVDLHGRRIRVDYSATTRPHEPTPGQYKGIRRDDFGGRDRYGGDRYGGDRYGGGRYDDRYGGRGDDRWASAPRGGRSSGGDRYNDDRYGGDRHGGGGGGGRRYDDDRDRDRGSYRERSRSPPRRRSPSPRRDRSPLPPRDDGAARRDEW
ncbi:hypothetical protein ACM66B_002240 [Microbotryomycetes sp. NB124-2]